MIPADLVRLAINEHSIDRFVERAGVPRGQAEAELLALADVADEVRLGALRGLVDDRRDAVRDGEARYFRNGGWILACVDPGRPRPLYLVTVFPGDRVWRFARKVPVRGKVPRHAGR